MHGWWKKSSILSLAVLHLLGAGGGLWGHDGVTVIDAVAWPRPFAAKPAYASSTGLTRYIPWSQEEEQKSAWDKVLPALGSTGVTLYGTALLLYSKSLPGQIHIITMMRATGFNKIEKALTVWSENVRDAWWSAAWNSPNFLRAKVSYRTTSERMESLHNIIRETNKAKEDGVITPEEAAKIKKLKAKEMKKYQKEMKNLARAASSFRKVIVALDLDEVRDIARGFFFQMMAVFATGNDAGLVSKVISRWCLFLNLGSLFLDANSKLHFPLSKMLLAKTLRSARITEEQARSIERTGQALMFSSAGYLVVYHNSTARDLNAAAVSSAIIFRGVRSLVETFWDRVVDDNDIWSVGNGFLEGPTGGMLMIAFTAIGVFCRKRIARGKMFAVPKWVVAPFEYAEKLIDKLVYVIDKVM